jgi:hypothetical protein
VVVAGRRVRSHLELRECGANDDWWSGLVVQISQQLVRRLVPSVQVQWQVTRSAVQASDRREQATRRLRSEVEQGLSIMLLVDCFVETWRWSGQKQ